MMTIRGTAWLFSHGIAHGWIYGLTGDWKRCNNAVHYSDNTMLYKYDKRYWSPSFMRRYGLPFLKISMYDVKALCDCHVDTAKTGKWEYW